MIGIVAAWCANTAFTPAQERHRQTTTSQQQQCTGPPAAAARLHWALGFLGSAC